MALYNGQSRLRDIIFANPAVISVINRLGVRLGVGDETICDSCRRHDIDPAFFLAVVNTYVNDDYFPEDAASSFDFKMTVDYLMKTDAYYQRVQLPNIERHLDMLISRSDTSGNNLELLRKFFLELKQELQSCIAADHEKLFPFLLADPGTAPVDRSFLALARHQSVEEKIDDLLSFFVMHLRGDYDNNLCVAVVTAIFSLQKDINQNNRIRERILVPQAEMLLARCCGKDKAEVG